MKARDASTAPGESVRTMNAATITDTERPMAAPITSGLTEGKAARLWAPTLPATPHHPILARRYPRIPARSCEAVSAAFTASREANDETNHNAAEAGLAEKSIRNPETQNC